MKSRDAILEAIRRNQPTAVALPEIPRFDQNKEPLQPRFQASLERMGGRLAALPESADLKAWIEESYPEARVICSATPEISGTRDIGAVAEPKDLEDVDLGVVRAAFGVAETGSVYLSDREFRVNALGYLAQHLLVLLDPEDLVGNLHHAFARPEFADAGYSVLVTGPSATADIEGVLIHGAQGVRSLTVALLPKPSAAQGKA